MSAPPQPAKPTKKPQPDGGTFDWQDPLKLDGLLTEEQYQEFVKSIS